MAVRRIKSKSLARPTQVRYSNRVHLQIGNYLLIALGTLLAVSGPWLLVRTLRSFFAAAPPSLPHGGAGQFDILTRLVNIIIALLFLGAGVLFILNNLRGNPLALP